MMKYSRRLVTGSFCLSFFFLVWLSACRTAPPPQTSATPFDPAKLAAMDAAINQAIADNGNARRGSVGVWGRMRR
jgi:hypothetical protein